MYRNFLSIFISLLCTASAAALPSALDHTIIESRQTPDNSCATGVHIVVGPGWTSGGTNYGDQTSTVNAIMSAIPGSNSYVLGPYRYPQQNDQFVTDTAEEETELRQYLADYSAACPDTYIVLSGSSAGGVTVMNTLCGASPSPPWPSSSPTVSNYKYLAALTYGDETFVGGMPYNAGTCQNSAPYFSRTDTSTCTSFFSYIQSYCDAQDPLCCQGGTDSSYHGTYNQRYDSQIAQFVADAYASATGQK